MERVLRSSGSSELESPVRGAWRRVLFVSASVFAACVLLQLVLSLHPTDKVFGDRHAHVTGEEWDAMLSARHSSPLRHVRAWYHANYRTCAYTALASFAVLGLSAGALAALGIRDRPRGLT